MDEKMMILKMLEEGRITSEEALKLLESLEKTNATDSDTIKTDKTEHNNYNDKFNEKNEKFNEKNEKFNEKFNEKMNKFSKKAEQFADKFGPDFISKVESVSSDFAEAAVRFADKIVNYINSGFNSTDIYKTATKNFNFPVCGDELVKVVIKTQNLSVTTDYTDSSEITMDMNLKLLFEEEEIDKYIFTKVENGVIYLYTDFPIRTWGSLAISLPKNAEAIEIETSNSKCMLENFKGKILHCTSSNGRIEIKGCEAEDLNARTNNGRINIFDTKCHKAEIHTSNGNIEIERSFFDRLMSDTSNGSISLYNFDCISDGEASYTLQTSNGKIKINLPKNNGSGYKINARTSLGNINISNLDSTYIIDRGHGNIKAEAAIASSGYESYAKKLNIEATTSNSSINITND